MSNIEPNRFLEEEEEILKLETKGKKKRGRPPKEKNGKGFAPKTGKKRKKKRIEESKSPEEFVMDSVGEMRNPIIEPTLPTEKGNELSLQEERPPLDEEEERSPLRLEEERPPLDKEEESPPLDDAVERPPLDKEEKSPPQDEGLLTDKKDKKEEEFELSDDPATKALIDRFGKDFEEVIKKGVKNFMKRKDDTWLTEEYIETKAIWEKEGSPPSDTPLFMGGKPVNFWERKSKIFGIEWINPVSDQKGWDKLTGLSKTLRILIETQYKNASDQQKLEILYHWEVDYLTQIKSNTARTLLFMDPKLSAWEEVFKWKTEAQNIVFNIGMLEVYNVCLKPEIWAGLSMKTTLILYYIFMTGKYIVFEDASKFFFQYNGKYWEKKETEAVITEVMVFATSLRVQSIDGKIFASDKDYIERLRYCFTITKFPYITGYNLKDGFLTHKDGEKYIFSPHSPTWWQTRILDITIAELFTASPDPAFLRYLNDSACESVISWNLLRAVTHYTMAPGSRQLIGNLAGTQKGGKSVYLKLVEKISPNTFWSANLSKLDNFQRYDLLVGSTVIAFPDTSPKGLQRKEIDFFKGVSGGDKIAAEKKFGQQKNVRPEGFILIINNESFEDVAAYRTDAALASRVLNVVFPALEKHVSISWLEEYLYQGLSWFILWGISIDPDLINLTQRATAANELTGSGVEKPLLQFFITNCAYKEGESVKGADLNSAYVDYLREKHPKVTTGSLTGFYKDVDEALQQLTPKNINRKKTAEGQTFTNLVLTKTKDITKKGGIRFSFEGDALTEAVFSQNPLKIDAISFVEENGQITRGPWLDPTKNLQAFKTLEQIKGKSLWDILKLPVSKGKNQKFFSPSKHFVDPQIVGGKKIWELKAEEFEEKFPVSFQEELEIRSAPTRPLNQSAEFITSRLAEKVYSDEIPFITNANFDEDDYRIELNEMGLESNWTNRIYYGIDHFTNFWFNPNQKAVAPPVVLSAANFQLFKPALPEPTDPDENQTIDIIEAKAAEGNLSEISTSEISSEDQTFGDTSDEEEEEGEETMEISSESGFASDEEEGEETMEISSESGFASDEEEREETMEISSKSDFANSEEQEADTTQKTLLNDAGEKEEREDDLASFWSRGDEDS